MPAEPYVPAADKVLIEAFWRFVPIALIAIAFGVVYWAYRKMKSRREDAQRKVWIEERRAARAARTTAGPNQGAPKDSARTETSEGL